MTTRHIITCISDIVQFVDLCVEFSVAVAEYLYIIVTSLSKNTRGMITMSMWDIKHHIVNNSTATHKYYDLPRSYYSYNVLLVYVPRINQVQYEPALVARKKKTIIRTNGYKNNNTHFTISGDKGLIPAYHRFAVSTTNMHRPQRNKPI
jgi:hypothetical protein